MDKAWREAMDDLKHTALGVKAERDEAVALLREAQEELRLIRMKDTATVYDPTLRVRVAAFLASLDKAAK